MASQSLSAATLLKDSLKDLQTLVMSHPCPGPVGDSPDGRNDRNPAKPGGLTDSCAEPFLLWFVFSSRSFVLRVAACGMIAMGFYEILHVGPGQFLNYEGQHDILRALNRGLWRVTHNAYTQVSSP